MDIYKSITELKEGQERILALLQSFNSSNATNKIYDLVDLQEMLHVSRRTIATWKSQGLLPFSQIGKKVYVTQENLNEFLKKFNQEGVSYE